MNEKEAMDSQLAGTGFMEQADSALRTLARSGYTETLVPHFDCLEARGRRIRPAEFVVDELLRFENTSDPSDQSVLYAISCPSWGIKGTLLESYGLYQEDHSPEMLDKLGQHLH